MMELSKKIQHNCYNCEKKFFAYISNKRKYCSLSCCAKINYKYKKCFQKTSIEERFFKNVIKDSNEKCWLWIGLKNKAGYGRFSINRKHKFSHRYSFEFHYGDIPDNKIICHSCDNTSCVNPEHLYLGDHQTNTNDRIRKNRSNARYGSNHPNSKLKEKDIYEIKNLIKNKYSLYKLSKMFNVSWHTLKSIKNNQTWKHVK